MTDTISTRYLPHAEGYQLWAQVYDSQPNPMLSLEQRYLETILPSVNGRDVVDMGCGTGRWLAKFAKMAPKSLIGMDNSEAMLIRAAAKLGNRANLLHVSCEDSTLAHGSADLILNSFLVSYISDICRFANEIRRIARPGADIFVCDVHPATETAFGWRRGFRMGKASVELATTTRSLDQLIAAFESSEMYPVALIEPRFGVPEVEILRSGGKLPASGSSRDFPAIYILQFKCKPTASSKVLHRRNPVALELNSISGARIALGSDESQPLSIGLCEGKVARLGVPDTRAEAPLSTPSLSLDLNGYLVLPGLVNAHDHLEFALFPRLGKGGYRNFSEWAADIHHPDCSPVREHRAVPKSTRLWWGAIRNLLAGVTTVCHHNPYIPEVFESGFPIRVLRDFGWAHSLTLDSRFASKAAETPAGQPFLLHIGEGLDAESAAEIFALEEAAALSERAVIVHGLALNERGLSRLKNTGAALVWCPTSNQFLFGKTHSSEFIRSLPRVALGSDSSLTADGDLLDELRFAYTHVGISAEDLYSQVSTGAADVLRLRTGEGRIRVGADADFLAVRDSGLSPAETLARLTYADVELVAVGGRVQLASQNVLSMLPSEISAGLEHLEIGGVTRWLRAPIKKIYEEAASCIGNDLRLNGRPVRP
jgi:cytosine/adenosine deaminase-related metal-dependent hydrolase/ubiquinone/menaquinone biosynthesis C-methylase UbiE